MNPEFKGFIYVVQNMDKETDRGMVLILSGFLEEVLLKAILAFMVDGTDRKVLAEGPGAPLGGFSARISIAFALGLITAEDSRDLGIVRSIRNDFAHEPGASFDREPIKNRCRELAHATEEVTEAKERYRIACIGLIMILLRRTTMFTRGRRQPLDPKYGLVWEDAPAEAAASAMRIS